MSFIPLAPLAPLALALGVIVALPLIAHIARQRPRERVPFGAMLLLRRVIKRLRRRRRVKDPLLLLLRMLAVALITLAVTGFRFGYAGDAPNIGGSGRVIVLVDRSLSMSLTDGGSTLLSRARTQATAILADLPSGTLASVIAFDDEVDALSEGLTADTQLLKARVAAIEPTVGGSNLRGALLEARRLLEGEVGEVILFSDEAGPVMVPAAKEELRRLMDRGSAVRPESLQAKPPRNVSVTAAKYGEGLEGGTIEIRVSNFGPDPVESACEVRLPDGQVIPFFADLPGEGEVLERVTVPREALGGVGEAHCDDPDLPADDSRFFHLPRVGASRVLVVDGDPGDTPTRSEVYFLERALAPWGGARSGVRPDVTTPRGLLGLDPQTHRVVFLSNVGDPRTVAPILMEFVRKGGSLVITGGSNVSPDRYNTALGALLPAPLKRVEYLAARGEPGVALTPPDSTLDMFEPFSRMGRSAFGEVASRRVLLFEPFQDSADVTTLLKYETGIPAMVERKVGQGRVVVWTSSVDYDWSNLPTQAVFMPLIQRLSGYLGAEAGSNAVRIEATVGEAVAVDVPDLTLQLSVTGPNGQPVVTRQEGNQLFFTPEQPGAYGVAVEPLPPAVWVAANLDPTESDVRAYDSVRGAETEIDAGIFLREVDLTPWFWAAGLVAMLAIALLSMGAREEAV